MDNTHINVAFNWFVKNRCEVLPFGIFAMYEVYPESSKNRAKILPGEGFASLVFGDDQRKDFGSNLPFSLCKCPIPIVFRKTALLLFQLTDNIHTNVAFNWFHSITSICEFCYVWECDLSHTPKRGPFKKKLPFRESAWLNFSPVTSPFYSVSVESQNRLYTSDFCRSNLKNEPLKKTRALKKHEECTNDNSPTIIRVIIFAKSCCFIRKLFH